MTFTEDQLHFEMEYSKELEAKNEELEAENKRLQEQVEERDTRIKQLEHGYDEIRSIAYAALGIAERQAEWIERAKFWLEACESMHPDPPEGLLALLKEDE